MNEARRQAYLNLIHSLLTCPNGEENQILQANSELVDAGLVQVILEKANNLRVHQNLDDANYLMNIAGHFLGIYSNNKLQKLPPFISLVFAGQLLGEIIQDHEFSENNFTKIHALMVSNLNLIDDDLAASIRCFCANFLPELDAESRTAVATRICIFSKVMSSFPLGSKGSHLEIAIAGYEIAITVFTRQKSAEVWAIIQNDLGEAYSERIRGKRADNLERAIELYQAALSIYTREAFPFEWARSQNNLGAAYNERIRGEKIENLEQAIAAVQASLEIYTRREFPCEWAKSQNNFGNAYIYRIAGEKAENLEQAFAAYQASLEIYTREAFPFEWANIQNNLGNAYFYRIRDEKAENLEQAIAAYQASLEIYTREAFPEGWAKSQNNLGGAYRDRIRGEKAENLEQAIAAYQASLEIYTREVFPFEWARSQSNLGCVYRNRIRGEKPENLELAIAAHQVSLEIYTREAFPEDWARSQNNLANAYIDRIRGEKAENLEMAIAASQAALSVYTPEAFPQEYAQTQDKLANAYIDRIEGEKAENIEMAIAASQAALSVYTREVFPQKWANTTINLAVAYSSRIRGEKAENIEMAIAASQAALSVYIREVFPQEWANTTINLAVAYRSRIRGEKANNLEMAINAYDAALSVYTKEKFPVKWATIQNNLGNAYNNRIRGEKAKNIEMAIVAFNKSLLVYTYEKYPFDWANSKNSLGSAYSDRIEGEEAENIEMAIVAYEESLLVYTDEAFPFERARIKNNLGNAYNRRIKGEKAENIKMAIEAHEAALKVRTRERFPFEWANSKVNLATTFIRNRGEKTNNLENNIEQLVNVQIAILLFREALSVYTREAFPIDNTRTLFVLGFCYHQYNRQLQEAYDTFKYAIETVESMRSNIIIGGEADRQKLAEEWNKLYQEMVEVCLEMENKTEALEYVERSKTRNLVELFHNTRNLPENERISFAEIRSLLGEDEVILEWYIAVNGFKVFIIIRDSTQPVVWESSSQDLQELEKFQQEYIDDIKDEQKYDNWKNQLETRLEKLAQILHIDEIISRIPENCQKLILVPFRYLHLLPLHALTSKRLIKNKEETGCLLELFPGGVRYTPSCQLLQLSQQVNPSGKESSPTRLFAMQNPTEDLDFTDIEVEAIAKSFNLAEVLIREKASKTGLQQQLAALQNADIAHFSCHGFFYFIDPRKSALILAGAKIATGDVDSDNKSYIRLSEDELLDIEKCLTLEEIFDLPLSKCSLVTLSACETGLTDIRDATDEYIGLPSGFLYAGATNIISTLWPVNDVSTAILMIRFYELFLSETRPPVAIALRESQLWLRDATVQDLVNWVAGCKLISDDRKDELQNSIEFAKKPEDKCYQSPHFWAAFCAIGQ